MRNVGSLITRLRAVWENETLLRPTVASLEPTVSFDRGGWRPIDNFYQADKRRGLLRPGKFRTGRLLCCGADSAGLLSCED